jgi:hypothetical protein
VAAQKPFTSTILQEFLNELFQKNAFSVQTSEKQRSLSRRSFLRRAGVATAATIALTSGAVLLRTGQTAAGQQADLDLDILNFALNLE